jgi:hypothetical protein
MIGYNKPMPSKISFTWSARAFPSCYNPSSDMCAPSFPHFLSLLLEGNGKLKYNILGLDDAKFFKPLFI